MSVFSDRAVSDYKGTSNRSTSALRVLSPPSSPFLGFGGVLRVLVIVALLILFASVIGNLTGREPMTFASFLEMLQTAPSFGTDWLRLNSINISLPEGLGWLVPAVNFIEGVVSVGGFIITGFAQALLFILHFLNWIFI